jgi:hypothetical protein
MDKFGKSIKDAVSKVSLLEDVTSKLTKDIRHIEVTKLDTVELAPHIDKL